MLVHTEFNFWKTKQQILPLVGKRTNFGFFNAGASLTPSPVMAATSPSPCKYSTIELLWDGSTREKSLKGENHFALFFPGEYLYVTWF